MVKVIKGSCVYGSSYIHFALGSVIDIRYSELIPATNKDLLHNQDVCLPGIAGVWRPYRRKAKSIELKRISHGDWLIYYIWRRGHPLKGAKPNNWQSWRVFAAYPLRFTRKVEAWDFVRAVEMDFRNIYERKPSICVDTVGKLVGDVIEGSTRKV